MTDRASSGQAPPFDAILVVGFGGPEKPDDVLPFLANVLRGKPVPRERMLEVAEHYYHFGGVSPINGQVRELIEALRPELQRRGVALPVYWGNRNWHPMLADTVRRMADDGVRHGLALVLSAYSSYSSCRQYLEDLERARAAAGERAPALDKVRAFFNHPEFIAANADRVGAVLGSIDPAARARPHVAFTAHSIPVAMAATCDYAAQLAEASRLVGEALGLPADRLSLAYQSRSGRPQDPWLEPDIQDHLEALAVGGVREVVVHPLGFLSDHMEVVHDLDIEARQAAERLGLVMHRSQTVGTHPRFVGMLAELVEERLGLRAARRAAGRLPARDDRCAPDCCIYQPGRPRVVASPDRPPILP